MKATPWDDARACAYCDTKNQFHIFSISFSITAPRGRKGKAGGNKLLLQEYKNISIWKSI